MISFLTFLFGMGPVTLFGLVVIASAPTIEPMYLEDALNVGYELDNVVWRSDGGRPLVQVRKGKSVIECAVEGPVCRVLQ